LVTFQEWQKYIELQKEIEAQKAASGALKNDAYGDLLDVLYKDDSLSAEKKRGGGGGAGSGGGGGGGVESYKRYS
jgi:hypothetical protein